jgi:WD40 repeat protein
MVEPELIDRLIAAAAAEPGILPLLQETLVQLWDKRADQTLTLADYEALGDGERHGLAVVLVTASHDKTARVWNAATGKPVTSRLEHQDSVLSAAFSPDGIRMDAEPEHRVLKPASIG